MTRSAHLRAGLGLLAIGILLSGFDCAGSEGSKADWSGLPVGVRNAADSILSVVMRETRLAPRRSRGEVNPIYLHCHRVAARFEMHWQSDSLGVSGPFAILDRELPRMGWRLDEQSRADGPDGMVYSFKRGKLLCVVEGRWDGGDPTDSTVVIDATKSVLVDVASSKPCPEGEVKD